MSAFSITPVTNMPAQTAGEFPQYLQFQADGANLGGRDADTLNFGSGLTATRGVGVNANVVSVTAAGDGGGNPSAVFQLAGATTGTFNGTRFDDWSPATPVLAASYVAWDDAEQGLRFSDGGIYAVTIECNVAAKSSGSSTSFPRDDILYGSQMPEAVGNDQTQLGFNSSALGLDARSFIQWTDSYTISVDTGEGPALVQPRIYCKCYNSNDGKDSDFSAVVTITKLS